MNKIYKILVFILTVTLFSCESQNIVNVYYNTHSSTLTYGIAKFGEHKKISGHSINEVTITSTSNGIFILTPD